MIPRITYGIRNLSSQAVAERLRHVYMQSKKFCEQTTNFPRVDPRAVFVNNELDLSKIDVYGFDYDFTLAIYSKKLNELIYGLAAERLIQQYKYPEEILSIKYDMSFAIRGLHFDVAHSCLLKVDGFSTVQRGTVFRGRLQLSDEEVRKIYPGFGLPDVKGRDFPQLIDLFSLPWAGLLSTVIHYLDTNMIVFDPKSLYDDVAASISAVHTSGDMYKHVGDNLKQFVHPNVGIKEYLEFLVSNQKEIFVVTNSPYSFINVGMTYMLGEDWRKYFKHVVVSARKPSFFFRNEPFRLYDEITGAVRFEKVADLKEGNIYCGGNIEDFSKHAGYHDKSVLYFGDHIYTDLADPMLRLGWRTAAIVPELAREIRTQNDTGYRNYIQWMQTLTVLIEKYQSLAKSSPEAARVIETWYDERQKIREHVKVMFNQQFGSLFRTYTNMTYFSRRLNRLADIYTSRVPNLLKYPIDHCFFPRRNSLPHEAVHPCPIVMGELEKPI